MRRHRLFGVRWYRRQHADPPLKSAVALTGLVLVPHSLKDEPQVLRIDDQTLEVDKPRERNVNDVFELLSRQGIVVTSMRSKASRLEELFMRMVEKQGDTSQ